MRLYLQKDPKQELFIDVPKPLPQHQIDGIRFLYIQFKKKNPGVILNDPSGYGKRMQVSLFLKGIKPVLLKPILVFCPKESIAKWREYFLDWAGNNDIAVESSNAFAKYLVFINTIEDVNAFCRRQWSMVVLENNDFHKDTANITKKVLHFALKSEMKIWVTSVEMKAHLDIFPVIYHWLNPEDKTNIQDLTQKGNGLKDELSKLILLEAFLEDIVIRRNNFLTPFKKTKPVENCDEENLQEITQKRSRKCKDITGKKVKRSIKRVIEDDEVDFSVTTVINSTGNVLEVAASRYDDSAEYFNFTNGKNDEVTENNVMDVETFIRDQEPIKSAQSNYVNDVSQTEFNTNDFKNAINEIVKNENKILRDDCPSLSESIEENKMDVKNSNVSENLKTIEISNTCNSNFKTPKNNNSDLNINNKEVNIVLNNICDNVNVKKKKCQEIIEANIKTFDNIANTSCEVPTSRDENVNIKKEETNSNAFQKKVEEVNIKQETESKHNADKDITEQISDIEKDALNKFKGSILDTLFKFK